MSLGKLNQPQKIIVSTFQNVVEIIFDLIQSITKLRTIYLETSLAFLKLHGLNLEESTGLCFCFVVLTQIYDVVRWSDSPDSWSGGKSVNSYTQKVHPIINKLQNQLQFGNFLVQDHDHLLQVRVVPLECIQASLNTQSRRAKNFSHLPIQG